MKVLNLYAGIGGNRKFWKNCEVTAVESNENIAKVYQDLYPNDTVIVADAHDYLLKNYKNFDFIWSSPPCQTHSAALYPASRAKKDKQIYIDLTLYQEIIFLQNYCKKKYVVENVKPYYIPLIEPTHKLNRHYFWSNFNISQITTNQKQIHKEITSKSKVYGFNLDKYNIKNKRQLLRYLVNPAVGLHIFNEAQL
jgi:DNA (cytosine-5)-methyltransferase 1